MKEQKKVLCYHCTCGNVRPIPKGYSLDTIGCCICGRDIEKTLWREEIISDWKPTKILAGFF